MPRATKPAPAPDTLPPDPEELNGDRAAWAETAVEMFKATTGVDNEDAVADLIADLMHLCDREHKKYGRFETQLDRAKSHYEAETEEQ